MFIREGSGRKTNESEEGQKMLYSRLTFTTELNAEAILPKYKGSTFRGAFGNALKRVVCALERQNC